MALTTAQLTTKVTEQDKRLAALERVYVALHAEVLPDEPTDPAIPVVPAPAPSPSPTPTPTPSPSPTPAPAGQARFFRNSIWTKPLTGNEPVRSNSAALISLLRTVKGDNAQLQVSADNGWGVPIFYAKPGDPRINMKGGTWYFDNVPVPAGATEGAGEGYCVVVDEAAGLVYNFLQYKPALKQFYAAGLYRLHGSGFWDPSGDPAHPGPWSGASSGASYLAGCILREEIDAGFIGHGLCMTLDTGIQAQGPALPAKITDGQLLTPSWPNPGVPNGTRIRIRRDVNIGSLGLGRTAAMLAQALQTFGGIFVDRSAGISFRCEATKPWDDVWSAANQAGLTGKLFSYCDVLEPVSAGEYDHPGRFNPAQPHN